jgi:deoxyhypusine synthase
VLKDRTGVAPAARPGQAGSKRDAGVVRAFMEHNYRHFNARATVAAARAYEAHVDGGGKRLMTLAGAMSTAQLGVSLALMIRAGKVQSISCTGAYLE